MAAGRRLSHPRRRRRFENWETYYAGKIGLGVAADYALALGLDAIAARIHDAGGAAARCARASSTASTCSTAARVLGATVTFTVDGATPDDVERHLGGAHVTSRRSDAVARLQLDDGGARIARSVRSSVHYYNNDESSTGSSR